MTTLRYQLDSLIRHAMLSEKIKAIAFDPANGLDEITLSISKDGETISRCFSMPADVGIGKPRTVAKTKKKGRCASIERERSRLENELAASDRAFRNLSADFERLKRENAMLRSAGQ